MQLPEKSMASLVKHYYLWKKSRDRVSFIDRQVKRLSCNPKEDGDFHSDDDSSGSEGSGREGVGFILLENFGYYLVDLYIGFIHHCSANESNLIGLYFCLYIWQKEI